MFLTSRLACLKVLLVHIVTGLSDFFLFKALFQQWDQSFAATTLIFGSAAKQRV